MGAALSPHHAVLLCSSHPGAIPSWFGFCWWLFPALSCFSFQGWLFPAPPDSLGVFLWWFWVYLVTLVGLFVLWGCVFLYSWVDLCLYAGILEWFGLKGASKLIQFHLLIWAGTNFHYPSLIQTLSSLPLDTSKDRAGTASLDSSFTEHFSFSELLASSSPFPELSLCLLFPVLALSLALGCQGRDPGSPVTVTPFPGDPQHQQAVLCSPSSPSVVALEGSWSLRKAPVCLFLVTGAELLRVDAIGSGPELAVIMCGIMGCWVLGEMDIRTKEQLLGKGIRVVDTKKICSMGIFFSWEG